MRSLIESQQTIKTPPATFDKLQEILDFAIAREKDAKIFIVIMACIFDNGLTIKRILESENADQRIN
ncbi:MAG: hypothetical protein GY801_13895 [bacterium]|nr:hypothetical protein [bacterium]